MALRLIESLATTEPLARLFSDDSILRAMLDFEVALAAAESRLGVIPASAAKSIAAAANPEAFDILELARKSLRAGTPSIPLVKALTELVRLKDEPAACYSGLLPIVSHRSRLSAVREISTRIVAAP